jgi:hypothetical protein
MAIDLTTPAEAISESNTLFSGLIVGAPDLPEFPEPPEITITDPGPIPDDLSAAITVPTVDQLTSGAVAGDGVFDRLMSSIDAHIESQYHKNILGKSELAQVYSAAITAMLPQAIQFLLTKDQVFWASKLVQVQAQNAWLERSKLLAELQTAKLLAFKAQADAATAQMQAVTAQTAYANQKLQLMATLQSVNTAETQEAVAQAQYDAAYVQTHNTLPGGGAPGGVVAKDLELKDKQIDVADKQILLLGAQVDVQRAQTRNTNADGTPVEGIIETQKNLYTQQIDSYVQDGKNKGVKLIADLWTSAKALDDAVQMPGPVPGNLMMAMNTYLNGLGLPNAMVGADTPGTGAPSSDTNWNTPGKQT